MYFAHSVNTKLKLQANEMAEEEKAAIAAR